MASEPIAWRAPLGFGVAAFGAAAFGAGTEPRAGAGPDGAEADRVTVDPAEEAREPTAWRAPLGLGAAAGADAWVGAALTALGPAVAPWVFVEPTVWIVAPTAWPTLDGAAAGDPSGDEPVAPEPDGAE